MAELSSIWRTSVAAGRVDFILDQSGLILEIAASGANARLASGVSEGEGIADYIHPVDRHYFALVCNAVMEPGSPDVAPALRIRWLNSRGRYSLVSARISCESGETVRVSLARDGAEGARRRATQLLKVVEGSLQAIIVRTNKQILFMNDGFARMLGYGSARELMEDGERKDLNSGIHPDDVPMIVERVRRRMSGEEAVSHYEFRMQHRDGSYRWLDTLATSVVWDGQMASLSWLTDVTERKAMEAEIVRGKEEAEFANRSKTEFLAHMSHELRTPLNAIIGFAEVIKDQIVGPIGQPKYADYANDIHKSGLHLLGLINDVLDLSKLEAGRLELCESDVSLSLIVEQTCSLMRENARSAGVKLLCDAPNALPALRGDERALRQVLLNFISNAIKFTPRGRGVVVSAELLADGRLAFSVADTGIGMSADEIRIALMPYGQIDSKIARRHKGTGLGLPISKSLIELHGGELRIESAPGEGTTLTAIFPAARVCRAAA